MKGHFKNNGTSSFKGRVDFVNNQSGLPQKVAIVRSLPGLGDLLCLVPALKALRTALPKAQMTLIGLPWAKNFVQRFNCYLDNWLEFPGYPGIPEVPLSPSRIVSFLKNAQRLDFDIYALTNIQHTPWGVSHRVLFHDVPCRLCYKSICPEGHHDCLRLVEPETVVQAALELLEMSEGEKSSFLGSDSRLQSMTKLGSMSG